MQLTRQHLNNFKDAARTLPTEKDTPHKQGSDVWEMTRSILLAVLIAVVFRTFVYEPFHIPSSSMKPTLEIGDYIFVSKSSYGYSRYSVPFGLPLWSGRILKHTPERGDVVVFKLPSDPSINFIKRLIGLPGDTIQVREGILYLNGKEVPRELIGTYRDPDNHAPAPEDIPVYRETLESGRHYATLDQRSDEPADNTDVYTVPAGHYFMMGDNRDNSTDSRFTEKVGFIPEENLVGRATVVLLPQGAPLWRLDKWFKNILADRSEAAAANHE